MGQIVGATLTTHVPRLMIFDEAARRAYMGEEISTFYAALEQLYEERIAPLDFGTFLIVDTHWWTTLDYIVNAHERHQGVYTSDELPAMLHDCHYDYPGDRELAELIAMEAKAAGIRAYAMTPRFFGRLSSIPGIVAIKEVLTDLQHLEALFDAVAGRLTVLQTFRAFFTGLLLGAVGGFINIFAVPACVRITEVMKQGDLPMGPPRPPYMAPPDAEEQLRKRLPDLLAVL
jgi:hypothetical protein